MADNITDLNLHKQKKESKAKGENFVNAFIQASLPDLKTTALESMLRLSDNLVRFSGNDAGSGSMERADNESLVKAAKSERYQLEPIPQLNVLKLHFGSSYTYALTLGRDVEPAKFNDLVKSLAVEQKENFVIERSNHASMGFPTSERLPWPDKQDFKTEALDIIMGGPTESIKVATYNEQNVDFVAMKHDDVINLAKNNIFGASVDNVLNEIHLSFNDESMTYISLQMKDNITPDIREMCINTLKTETAVNGSYNRANNPDVLANIAKASHFSVDLDDDMKEYMSEVLSRDEVKDEPEPNQDNVVPMKPR